MPASRFRVRRAHAALVALVVGALTVAALAVRWGWSRGDGWIMGLSDEEEWRQGLERGSGGGGGAGLAESTHSSPEGNPGSGRGDAVSSPDVPISLQTSSQGTTSARPRPPHPSPSSSSPDSFISIRQRQLSQLHSLPSFRIGSNPDSNEAQLLKLVSCLEQGQKGSGPCFDAPAKVVLAAGWYFTCSTRQCSTSGEVIWLRSVIESFHRQSIFYLAVDDEDLPSIWRQLGDVVISQVWVNDEVLIDCVADRTHCIKSVKNTDGIPAWKLFTITFWGSMPGDGYWQAPREPWSFNPLGSEWTLTPYRMPNDHTYLGYNLCPDQGSPSSPPHIPSASRKHGVLILAKYLMYFDSEQYKHTWPKELYPALRAAIGDDVVSVATTSSLDQQGNATMPEGIDGLGLMIKEDYGALLADSKVMLGIGMPEISPSPFFALCSGVPVILPYWGDDPIPQGWAAFTSQHQHAVAALAGPPYVYSLPSNSTIQQIISTIELAISHPIDRYVPPDMTERALDERIREVMERDWKALGEEKLARKGWTWETMKLQEHLQQKVKHRWT